MAVTITHADIETEYQRRIGAMIQENILLALTCGQLQEQISVLQDRAAALDLGAQAQRPTPSDPVPAALQTVVSEPELDWAPKD